MRVKLTEKAMSLNSIYVYRGIDNDYLLECDTFDEVVKFIEKYSILDLDNVVGYTWDDCVDAVDNGEFWPFGWGLVELLEIEDEDD